MLSFISSIILLYCCSFKKNMILKEIHIDNSIIWTYFLGPCQDHGPTMEVGFVLYHPNLDQLQFKASQNMGTNNIIELYSLYYLLNFGLHIIISHIQIFGDSLLTINWMKGWSDFNNIDLSSPFIQIKRETSQFQHISVFPSILMGPWWCFDLQEVALVFCFSLWEQHIINVILVLF